MEEIEQRLIVLVGLPRSGKSTWAKGQKDAPIVCPDAIRYALHGQRFAPEAEEHVFAIAKTMVRALFLAGHKRVIVDATNTTKKRRDFWKNQPSDGKASWVVEFVLIATPAVVCKQRATAEGDEAILPVIDRMAAQWEAIDKDEGAIIAGQC